MRMSLNDKMMIVIATAILTFLFNLMFHWLKNKFDWGIDKKKFKRERSYEQLTVLYLDIYKIIIQSEYVRYIFNHYEHTDFTFYYEPFLEIGKSNTKIKKTLISKEGKINQDEKVTKTEIQDEITSFNKKYIYEKILDNGHLASVRLMKIAVAYRYCHSMYLKQFEDPRQQDYFQEEELRLLRLMLSTIIKETNKLMEICHMDIDGVEISYGHPNNSIFEEDRGE